MRAMNESFVSVHDALDRALIRKGHIRKLEILEGNQAVEISKLKEEFKRLKGESRSREQGIETLMVEKVDLVDQVMN